MEQTDILIPYVLGPDNGLELKFALRSIEANFQYGNYRIVIGGEKPDWLNDTAEFIPVSRNTSAINQNARDTMAKFKSFLEAYPDNKEFILTYDDIYFSSPVTHSDIRMLIAADCFQNPGHLKQAKAGTHWISLMEKTMNLVQESGGSTFNYETHLPRIFDKNRFGLMMERFPLTNRPLCVQPCITACFTKRKFRFCFAMQIQESGFCSAQPSTQLP